MFQNETLHRHLFDATLGAGWNRSPMGAPMSTVAKLPKEPSCYVINLYTWLTDKQAAMDLAQRVVEIVGAIPEIDDLSTTVSEEDDPTAEPERVFLHLTHLCDAELRAAMVEVIEELSGSSAAAGQRAAGSFPQVVVSSESDAPPVSGSDGGSTT
jgi:hypothetical protein